LEEKEVKKESKFKRGCLGCLGIIIGIILSLIIFDTVLGLISGTIFMRKEIYGRVYDKETKKPVGYVLISTACLPDLGSVQVLANKEGFYKIKKKLVWSTALRPTEWGFKRIEREGQILVTWFPGYKKYEITTEGRKLLSGRIDIYLERPKTAEEAVEILNTLNREYLEKFGIFPKNFGAEELNKKMKEKRYKTYDELVRNIYVEYELNWIINSDPRWKEHSHFSPDRNFENILKICQQGNVKKYLIDKIPCENLSDKFRDTCIKFKKEYKSDE
jgi:hypothetical protein